MSTIDAAGFYVNPFTAVCMCQQVKSMGQTWMIHTAAASALGQMMAKTAPRLGVEVLHIVRREEQAKILYGLGAKHVLVSSKESYADDLKDMVAKNGIRLAFDALGGGSPSQLMGVLPPGATVYVYGRLADSQIGPFGLHDMIYFDKKVEGFLVTRNLLRQKGGTKSAAKFVSANFAELFIPPSFTDVPLAATPKLFVDIDPHNPAAQSVTGKKFRVRPWK